MLPPPPSNVTPSPPQLLDRMRVFPDTEVAFISEAEWVVAHTYLCFAFRKIGASSPPIPAGGQPRHRKVR